MTEQSHPVDIYAEPTPNPDSLKFLLNRQFLESGTCDFPTRESAEGSSLPSALFEVDGVVGVMVGPNFITVRKIHTADWKMLVPGVVEAIKTFFISGKPPLAESVLPAAASADGDEIEQRIRRVLDEEVRPAVQRDGGDIIFYGYQEGVVTLHLQGACSTCPSSIMTLKMGVEARLKQAIPEVREVVQV